MRSMHTLTPVRYNKKEGGNRKEERKDVKILRLEGMQGFGMVIKEIGQSPLDILHHCIGLLLIVMIVISLIFWK